MFEKNQNIMINTAKVPYSHDFVGHGIKQAEVVAMEGPKDVLVRTELCENGAYYSGLISIPTESIVN